MWLDHICMWPWSKLIVDIRLFGKVLSTQQKPWIFVTHFPKTCVFKSHFGYPHILSSGVRYRILSISIFPYSIITFNVWYRYNNNIAFTLAFVHLQCIEILFFKRCIKVLAKPSCLSFFALSLLAIVWLSLSHHHIPVLDLQFWILYWTPFMCD